MADLKISQFPAATGIANPDIIPIVQGGFNRSITYDLLSQGVITKIAGYPLNNIVHVAKSGNDVNGSGGQLSPYLTINKALSTITTASASNPFLVLVDPGIYIEALLVVPDFVSVRGASIDTVTVQADTTGHHIFDLGNTSEISFMTLSGAGSGKAALTSSRILSTTGGLGWWVAHKVSIYNCDIGVLMQPLAGNQQAYLEYVDVDEFYSNAIQVNSIGAYTSFLNAENFYTYPDSASVNSNPEILVSGGGSTINISTAGITGTTYNTGVLVTQGARAEIHGSFIEYCLKGIQSDTNGSGAYLSFGVITFENNTQNISVENATTGGSFTGYTEYGKTYINPAAPFFITNQDSRTITVGRQGDNFTSISAACAAITNATATNPYTVYVGPGVYVEPQINIPAFVTVQGIASTSTIVVPDTNSHHVFSLSNQSEVSFLTVTNAGAGYAAFYVNDVGFFTTLHKVVVNNCDIGIWCQSTAGLCVLGIYNVQLNGAMTTAIKAFSTGANPCELDIKGLTILPTGTGTAPLIDISAPAMIASLEAILINAGGTQTGLQVSNGSLVGLNGCTINSCATSVHVPNVGLGPTINLDMISKAVVNDIWIENPATVGNIVGIADKNKVNVNPACMISMSYAGTDGAGQVVLQDIYQGYRQDQLLNLSKLIRSDATIGLQSGGVLSAAGGLQLNVAAGSGFLIDPVGFYLTETTWTSAVVTLAAGSSNYIYVTTNGTVSVSPTPVNEVQTVYLGRVFTLASTIDYIAPSVVNMQQQGNNVENYLRQALGPIYISGSTVTENATPFGLDITAGNYNYGTKIYNPAGGTLKPFELRYQNGSGGWNYLPGTTLLDNTKWDDGSGVLANITPGYYTKYSIYTVGDDGQETYIAFYPQAQYSSLLAAQQAGLPATSPDIINSVALIADVIVQQGAANITEIDDQRPRIGFKPSSVTASAYHENLLGLTTGNAGHTQFLMLDGSTKMVGSLDMNSNAVINAGTFNGITVEAHASRHAPNSGADALATAAPTAALSSASTNSVGIANSLSRSDHSHAITNSNLTEATSSVLTIAGGSGAVLGTGTSIQVKQAGSLQSGYLSSSDWSAFNSKQSALSFGNISESTSSVLTISNGSASTVGPNVSIQVKQAGASQSGYLSLTDWNTFNGKQAALSFGNLSTTTTGVTVGSGTGAVIGSGTTVNIQTASGSQPGLLSSTDWNTFNGKQAAGSYVTTISVATANGLAGSSSGGTTPSLTLSTTISGLLKGNATAISAATSGTDYAPGTSALATGILKSTTTTGALSIAIATDFPVLNQNTTGTAANITATSNATLTTLSALSLPYSQLSGTVPTWNQNTTGTAANITATSNATLTTLSALSLPYSQLSGTVPTWNQNTTGTAANITATSNATLTTLSALSLPYSQLSGTVPTWNQNTTGTAANVTGVVALANGGTNASTVAGARTNLGIEAGSSFITSGTTYTTPAGITSSTQFKFTLIGGGGGGAGVAAGSGNKSSGGGGGGVAIVYLTGLTASTGYTIAIGSAGAAGSTTPGAGGTGGNTTLTVASTTYTATGGTGGPTGLNTAGGAGGGTTNATIGVTGQAGGSVGAASTSTVSGCGGNNGHGWGLGGQSVQGDNAGATATGYGGGGGGGSSGGSAHLGGAGTAGAILVEYWN